MKWATLLHLARHHDARCIFHVAFLQPGPDWRKAKLASGSRRWPIGPEIWEHFPRDVARSRDLAVMTGIPIRILNAPFQDARRADYVARTTRQIGDGGAERKIVFLDPDNGIAPRHANGRHVTAAEVTEFWNILQPHDWLVLYQHRQRHAHWMKRTRAQFAAACGSEVQRVETYACREIAHDVVFFALRKSRRGDQPKAEKS